MMRVPLVLLTALTSLFAGDDVSDEVAQKALATFEQKYKSKEEHDRIGAVGQLLHYQHPLVIKRLAGLLVSDTQGVRMEACGSLGFFLPKKEVVDAYLEALPANAKDIKVQLGIITHLRGIDDPRVVLALKAYAEKWISVGDWHYADNAETPILSIANIHTKEAFNLALELSLKATEPPKKGDKADPGHARFVSEMSRVLGVNLGSLIGQSFPSVQELKEWWSFRADSFDDHLKPKDPWCATDPEQSKHLASGVERRYLHPRPVLYKLDRMKVGLTYNLKAELPPASEEHTENSEASVEEDEPPLPGALPPDFFAECDTMETVSAIQAALSRRHEVTLVEANEDAFQRFREARPDIVFNVAEGVHGAARESHIPAMLEMLRIPYTGSDPLSLALCLDKARTKEVLSFHGVPVPRTMLVASVAALERRRRGGLPFGFPMMVKPVAEGSSKGIVNDAVARTDEELEAQVRRVTTLYRQEALVEPYLEGREFTVALMGNGDAVECLPIVEIKFDSLPKGVNPIYSFEAKWTWDTAQHPLDIFECPAKVTPDLRREVERICVEAFRALRLRDWSRIDVRCDAAGRPYVLEVNPLPGILPKPEDNSCFPKAARVAGLSYDEMINRVLDIACARHGIR